ncbi:MAG: PIN domain-containing protein [Candidatus Anstonellaceae archaeon]
MAEIYEKGQVVIPKYLRDEFKMCPGTRVAFKRADKGVLVVPAYNVQEEMEKLRKEGATMSDAQVRLSMREMEKKRLKEMLDVPRLYDKKAGAAFCAEGAADHPDEPKIQMLPIDNVVLMRLPEYLGALEPRNAMHAATMRIYSISTICTFDRAFDKAKGILRQPPK